MPTQSPDEVRTLAANQRAKREAAQARVIEARHAKEIAEAEARRAMVVEYHLYRAAALAEEEAVFDRFEEAYLRWEVGLTASSLSLDPLMFDTEKVYRLVRFLASKRQIRDAEFDAQALRLEFPNWVDDLALIPTDGSIRSALKALSLRRTGLIESGDGNGMYAYVADRDAQPRFRRKSSDGDQDPAAVA